MMRTFGWSEFFFLVQALQWTVLLSLVAFIGGAIGGLIIALMRTSRWLPLRWLAIGYIQIVQGTPILMQLFLVYYGLVLFSGLNIDAWPAVTLTFTVYSAAFLGEIWRGSIEAIPRQQREAAECLALSYPAQLWHVILPQAFRISIPSTIGFMVHLVKNTSIASIIGFVEVTRAGVLMSNATFQPMVVFPIVAALYFIICWPLSLLSSRLERKLDVARIDPQHI